MCTLCILCAPYALCNVHYCKYECVSWIGRGFSTHKSNVHNIYAVMWPECVFLCAIESSWWPCNISSSWLLLPSVSCLQCKCGNPRIRMPLVVRTLMHHPYMYYVLYPWNQDTITITSTLQVDFRSRSCKFMCVQSYSFTLDWVPSTPPLKRIQWPSASIPHSWRPLLGVAMPTWTTSW